MTAREPVEAKARRYLGEGRLVPTAIGRTYSVRGGAREFTARINDCCPHSAAACKRITAT